MRHIHDSCESADSPDPKRSRAEVFRKERSSDVRTTARRKDLLILACRVFFKVDYDMCDIGADLKIGSKVLPPILRQAQNQQKAKAGRTWFTQVLESGYPATG